MEQRAERYAIPGNAWGAYQMPFLAPRLEAARLAVANELKR